MPFEFEAPVGSTPSITLDRIPTTRKLFDFVTAQIGKIGGVPQSDAPGPIAWRYGSVELASSDTWPRVIWVPGSDSFGPPTALADQLTMLPLRPRYVRHAGVNVYIHGQDTDMCELILNDYLYLLGETFTTSVMMGQGRWTTETDPVIVGDGDVYILPLIFALPVVRSDGYAQLIDVELYNCSDVPLE